MKPLLFLSFLNYKVILAIGLFLNFLIGIHAQEYVVNGGFEEYQTGCESPEQNFSNLESWTALNGTPDFFKETCNWDPDGAVFWENQDTAVRGDGFIGISCRFNANETFTTEAILGNLKEPLEANTTYQIEFYYRSQGFYQGFPDSLIACPLRPNRHIDIYLDRDSISVIQDFSNGRPELSSPPDLILDTKSIREHARSDWKHVRTCYAASGGEQFIAIALPFGNFGELPACLMMDNDATFYTFYFDIDEISITPLELELKSSISKCNNEFLDLMEIGVPEIYGSQIIWEDGDTNFVRRDFPFGEVDLSLLLPCEEIQFKLNIIEKNCELQFYIPNAFSPNGDLLHDLFLPVFGNDLLITNYKLRIFDRWGNLVYDGDASNSGWDGTFLGQIAANGTYAWVMEIFLPQKDPEVFSGSIHVFK